MLRDLTPEAISAEARRRLDAHAGRLALYGAPALTLELRPGTESDLELALRALTAYAQTGDDGWDWGGDPECAADALLSIHGALYQSASDPPSGPLAGPWLGDEDDPIALVARAALARVALARGEPVPRAWLASLASADPRTVRGALAEGQLADAPGPEGSGRQARPVTRASALAWLRSRGVAGLTE